MANEPWYRSDPAALAETIREAVEVQPHMTLNDEGDRVSFRGRFEVRDAAGTVIEAFAVEVELSPESPRAWPIVRETNGRIPRDMDTHHVIKDDGTLCVHLPDYMLLHHPTGMTLAEYLEGPLRDHLAGQGAVLRGHDWPSNDWRHGLEGVVQFYQEELDETDLESVFRLVLSETSSRHERRRMLCPCGSGKTRRRCHGATLRALGKGPNFRQALVYLNEKLKENHDGGGEDA